MSNFAALWHSRSQDLEDFQRKKWCYVLTTPRHALCQQIFSSRFTRLGIEIFRHALATNYTDFMLTPDKQKLRFDMPLNSLIFDIINLKSDVVMSNAVDTAQCTQWLCYWLTNQNHWRLFDRLTKDSLESCKNLLGFFLLACTVVRTKMQLVMAATLPHTKVVLLLHFVFPGGQLHFTYFKMPISTPPHQDSELWLLTLEKLLSLKNTQVFVIFRFSGYKTTH